MAPLFHLGAMGLEGCPPVGGPEDLSVTLVEELEGREDDADWEIEVPLMCQLGANNFFLW